MKRCNKMKKILAATLALALAVSLAACGNGNQSTPNTNNPGSGTSSSTPPATGTDWPTKPINLVVPWSAGGDTDFHARTLAQYLEGELGVTVNVVNTTGGGGSVASTEVKDSDPDGYTFLVFDSAIALNQASGITDFGAEAFDPVCIIGKSCGEFLVTRSDAPYNTVAELIAYTKDHPGEVIMAGRLPVWLTGLIAGSSGRVCDKGLAGAAAVFGFSPFESNPAAITVTRISSP